eukprot:1140485-Pelagomonas_calceolata.AAC.9
MDRVLLEQTSLPDTQGAQAQGLESQPFSCCDMKIAKPEDRHKDALSCTMYSNLWPFSHQHIILLGMTTGTARPPPSTASHTVPAAPCWRMGKCECSHPCAWPHTFPAWPTLLACNDTE